MSSSARAIAITLAFTTIAAVSAQRINEFKILEGHQVRDDYSSPLPYTYIDPEDLPESFTWGNVSGVSYLTKSLNQHIPQYCGSCWAHGALSSLADRIKIARDEPADEINLSIQYILNCAGWMAGSCHGGSHSGVYEFARHHEIPYDTCQPYLACSSDSEDGFCPYADFKCTPMNTCRTCDHSGACRALDQYPNATVGEYGTYSYYTGGFGAVVDKIKAEIFARGPVAAGVNAEPLVDYSGGIITDKSILNMMVNHVVSIVGWGRDEETDTEYWIVRNSWGVYTGEMGYFRIITGHNSLGIESDVAWATPGHFSVHNFPCDSDGSNCSDGDINNKGSDGNNKGYRAQIYVDPSKDLAGIHRRLQLSSS